MNFKEFNISDDIKKAIDAMGFENASPIQEKAIPVVLEGHDIIGQAQTGTGKTAAFGIPVLEMMDKKLRKPQVLILCPTRELALQVSGEMEKLSRFCRGVRTATIYGGVPYDRQIRTLKSGANVIIGTPGRIMDHMRRRTLKLEDIQYVILDEADEMLNMGFREDIETILVETPEDRQTLLFSATMPKGILDIVERFQQEPVHVKVTPKVLTTTNVDQSYYEIDEAHKTELLVRLMDINQPKLALVFCNTKSKVEEVSIALQNADFTCERLHGDMKQGQRTNVMENFRKGKIRILVATDVAARGIDVDDVEAVFNYDVPKDEESYVHRIGRTGRAGRTGKAFTFVKRGEQRYLQNAMRYSKAKVDRKDIPTLDEIANIKNQRLFTDIVEVVNAEALESQKDFIRTLMAQGHSCVDVAAALLKMQMDWHKDDAVDHLLASKLEREARKKKHGGYKKGGYKKGGQGKGGYKGKKSSGGSGKSRSGGKSSSSKDKYRSGGAKKSEGRKSSEGRSKSKKWSSNSKNK